MSAANYEIKDSRLWDWENKNIVERLDALRDTVMEIVQLMRKDMSLEKKYDFENLVNHQELRASREADKTDIEEKISEVAEKLQRLFDEIKDIPQFQFKLNYGALDNISETQEGIKHLKTHINTVIKQLQSSVS